jgi:hypothetical protein
MYEDSIEGVLGTYGSSEAAVTGTGLDVKALLVPPLRNAHLSVGPCI